MPHPAASHAVVAPLNPADSPSASQTPDAAYASDSPSKSHIGTRPFACWPCAGQSTQLARQKLHPLPKRNSQTYHAMLAPLPNSTVHLHPPRLLLLHRGHLHRDRHPRPAAPAVQTCVVSWREGALGEGSDLGRGESWGGGGGERQGAHRGEEGSRPEGLGEEREEGHGCGGGGGVHGVGWAGLVVD